MHWGAAVALSTIDLFWDVDYYFFTFWMGDVYALRDAPLCLLMIIWSPSHVYDLFSAVFVADLYHCYYGLSNRSPC